MRANPLRINRAAILLLLYVNGPAPPTVCTFDAGDYRAPGVVSLYGHACASDGIFSGSFETPPDATKKAATLPARP